VILIKLDVGTILVLIRLKVALPLIRMMKLILQMLL